MRRKLRFFLCLSILLASPLACSSENSVPLKVWSGDGALKHEFKVELALTPAEHAQGLMYRKTLGADRGMLFIFPRLTRTPFWMKNTLIPLDMVFITPDKKILSIVANAAPQTETPREPAGPYLYVLEIEGGRAAALGLQAGDKIQFELP